MIRKPPTGDGPALEWIKSSHSTPDGPDCVEVAATAATILVRDSKNTQGPRLTLAPTAWVTFLPYASGN